jgi:hypothetical protein
MISSDVGVWIAAIYSICLYTFVFKDTALFKFAEYSFIGLAAAYTGVRSLSALQQIAVKPISEGAVIWIIPLVLGLLLYTRYSKDLRWISRWPMSVLIGVGLGVTLRAAVEAQFLAMIRATFTTVIVPDALSTVNNILIIVGVISALTYFLFTVQHTGPMRYPTLLGRYFFMAMFGAAYGNTVMARYVVFTQRLMFLLYKWLGIRPYPFPI